MASSGISLQNKQHTLKIVCMFGGFVMVLMNHGQLLADFRMNGYGEMSYYPRLNEPARSVIDQQRLRLNMSESHGKCRLKVWSEARRNDSGELRPEWEFRLPEVYGEYNGKSFFARIGKQQIVWGSADGLFINDVVNPLDLREFLLPDLENIRLGQPSVRLLWRSSNWLVEGVWIRGFAETKLPGAMSAGSLITMPEGVDLPIMIRDPEKPSSTVTNSEWGFRVSGMVGHWDIAVNYLRSWRDIPAYRGGIALSDRMEPLLVLTPFYQKISTWGGSFSRPVGLILLRGEFSYIPDLLVETTETNVSDMVISQDFLTHFVGMDFRIKKTRIGFQFAQELFFGKADLMNRDRVDNVVTILVDRTLFRDSMQCFFFVDREFTQHDIWVRTEIGYRINNNVRITCGSHVFTGNKSGRLGRFHNWSNVLIKIKYSFSL